LGLDRDSALVTHLFDERNDASKALIKMAVKTVQAQGRKIGICG
jgi:pyruvate, water dikinase